MTLVVIVLLPLFVGLGFWQLDRGGQKTALLASLEQRLAAAPTVFDATTQYETFTSVIVSGQFDGRYFLLDNYVLDGRIGYEVLAVFVTQQGETLLVNRGFVEAPASRQQLPMINTPTQLLTLTGMVSRVLGEPVVLRQEPYPTAQWPVLLQAFQPAVINHYLPEFGEQNWQLRLDASQPGALEPHYVPVRVRPARHYAYAVQWFAMAVTLVAAYTLFGLGVIAGRPTATLSTPQA